MKCKKKETHGYMNNKYSKIKFNSSPKNYHCSFELVLVALLVAKASNCTTFICILKTS